MNYIQRSDEVANQYKVWVNNLRDAMFDTSLIFKTKGLKPPPPISGKSKGMGSNKALKSSKIMVRTKRALFDALNLTVIDEGETETEDALTQTELDLKEFNQLPDDQKEKYVINRITKSTFESWSQEIDANYEDFVHNKISPGMSQ